MAILEKTIFAFFWECLSNVYEKPQSIGSQKLIIKDINCACSNTCIKLCTVATVRLELFHTELKKLFFRLRYFVFHFLRFCRHCLRHHRCVQAQFKFIIIKKLSFCSEFPNYRQIDFRYFVLYYKSEIIRISTNNKLCFNNIGM